MVTGGESLSQLLAGFPDPTTPLSAIRNQSRPPATPVVFAGYDSGHNQKLLVRNFPPYSQRLRAVYELVACVVGDFCARR